MITVLFKKKKHSVTKRDWSISAACFSLCQDPVSIGSDFFSIMDFVIFSPEREKNSSHAHSVLLGFDGKVLQTYCDSFNGNSIL